MIARNSIVLVCLANRAGTPVSKDELLQTVWPETFVTDDVLTRSISELRKSLEDDTKEPHSFRPSHGRDIAQ